MVAMRALSHLPVDDDILLLILENLSDFQSLSAMMNTCKSIYTVFSDRSTSVLRRVASNVAGPPLPSVVRLVKFQLVSDIERQESENDISRWLKIPPPEPKPEEIDLSSEEIQALKVCARTAHSLEDLFSSRHKDRNSQKSTLSPNESTRFLRAIYRLMLFEKCFPYVGEFLTAEEEGEDTSWMQDIDDESKRKAVSARSEYLNAFSSDELQEISTLCEFMVESASWADVAFGDGISNDLNDDSKYLAVGLGPLKLLASMNGDQDAVAGTVGLTLQDYFDTDSNFMSLLREYVNEPLQKILDERGVKKDSDGSNSRKSIIDRAYGDQDACQRCGIVKGLDLINNSNIHRLRGIRGLSRFDLATLFKSKLSQNLIEINPFSSYIHTPGFNYADFMDGIFNVRTQAYDAWSKEDWACEECLKTLIRDHLHLFWLEHKRNDGQTIYEDCWYGYNCRTQTHSYHHATRLNHLCEPTRGD